MPIMLSCDAPGCDKQIAADRVDAMGRVHVRPPWCIYGGARTLVVCSPAHLTAAVQVKAVVPPLPALVDRPSR
jgi:hypothetical protein